MLGEEVWHGLGSTTTPFKGAGSTGSTNAWNYKLPTMVDGLAVNVNYVNQTGGGKTSADANTGASTDMTGSGTDVIFSYSGDLVPGLTIGGGISEVDREAGDDIEEETLYATYAVGGFTLGYQMSTEDLGTTSNEQKYENDGYGITFNVNDDLSIGYNHYESKQTSTTNVTAEASSVQVAYSAGGASVRVMRAQADNMDYSTAASQDRENTIVSIALAF